MVKKRVAVAMSGGVDSSVAAALLLKDGYNVVGITHQIWPSEKQVFGGCCGLDAIESARSVANKLAIPYYVLDLRQEFADRVIGAFCTEYASGRTPNPCILCNKDIRFGIMLDKVLKMGIDYMATGHYVRSFGSPDGFHLLKSTDTSKDQSYFLYTLGQKELRYLLFPVGNYLKTEIRKIAAELGLPSAFRKESQDICFIHRDYRSFIGECMTITPGDVVNTEGQIIGRHDGLAFYTIGQRHGLRVASGKPLYIIKLDKKNNRLIVGPREALFGTELTANNVNWISGKVPPDRVEIAAKIRYRAADVGSFLTLNKDSVKVRFNKPQPAITPGQSIVFYHGDEVLGGGVIE